MHTHSSGAGAADDDEAPSPAQSDDGAVIDQGAAFGDSGQVGGVWK
jgi:hypothetical protein